MHIHKQLFYSHYKGQSVLASNRSSELNDISGAKFLLPEFIALMHLY